MQTPSAGLYALKSKAGKRRASPPFCPLHWSRTATALISSPFTAAGPESDRLPLSRGKQGPFSAGNLLPPVSPLPGPVRAHSHPGPGPAYGSGLACFGNFLTQAEPDQYNRGRTFIRRAFGGGWSPARPSGPRRLYRSEEGPGGMRRSFRGLFREYLIRGQNKHRPTLLSSWRSTANTPPVPGRGLLPPGLLPGRRDPMTLFSARPRAKPWRRSALCRSAPGPAAVPRG